MEPTAPLLIDLLDTNETTIPMTQTTIPTAHLINSNGEEHDELFYDAATTIPFAQAATAEVECVIQDAVPIPSGDDDKNEADNIAAMERAQALAAEQMGRMLAQEELEQIQKAGRDINAINWHAKESVAEANRLAKLRELRDAFADSSITTEEPKNSMAQPKKEPEGLYEGTFGKEYEVSEYEVSSYGTKDYEISTYKSVYDP